MTTALIARPRRGTGDPASARRCYHRTVLAELLAAFPGSRLRAEAGGLTGPVCVLGTFHQLRVRFDPVVELFVDVPALDGFELEVHLGDRWLGDTDIGDPTIDDQFFIRTNDPALARTWLDEEARAVLRTVPVRLAVHDEAEAARITELRRRDIGDMSTRARRWMWPVHVLGEKVSLSRGRGGGTAAELVDMVEVACVIAGAPRRWADRLAAAVALTGGHVRDLADRIALGAAACTLEIQRVPVEIRYLRRDLPRAGGRLCTRVAAQFPSPRSVTWAVHAGASAPPFPALPRGPRIAGPPPLDWTGRSSHADEPLPFAPLEHLFARPTDPVIAATGTPLGIALWFDGAVLEPEALTVAARHVALLTNGARPEVGPYR